MLAQLEAVIPVTAAGTVTAGAQGERTLSVTMDGNTTQQVTVTCTQAGHPDGTKTVTFSTTGSCTALNARAAKHSASPEARNAISRGVCSEPEPDRCASTLALPAIGPAPPIAGTIAADSNCVSTQRRPSSAVRYYARRHHFALAADAWVTFGLDDADSDGRFLNPYLVILEGHSRDGSGTVVAANDDIAADGVRISTDARIGPVLLEAGSYTAEATTSGAYAAGAYTLAAEVTATGLAKTHTGTVGSPETITFHYWPSDAQVAIRAAANEELAPAIATAHTTTDGISHGTATITVTPRLVHLHRDVTIRVRSGVGAAVRERHMQVRLSAACGTGKQLSAYNGVLCVDSLPVDPVPTAGKYEVTPGTLLGVLASAQAVIDARGPTDTCGLTANKLAAFMLSIGFRETPFEDLNDLRPSPARSPMSLSRKDLGPRTQEEDEPDEAFGQRWSGYETRKELYLYAEDQSLTGPARAFFHPGVGLWQLDDAGDPADGWVGLNHGQRADTGLGRDGLYADGVADTGGEATAALLTKAYCRGTDDDDKLDKVENLMRSQWHACRYGARVACITDQFEHIYLGNSDDLYVTSAMDAGSYSSSGGVTRRSCRWSGKSSQSLEAPSFPCYFYDTERPEGMMHSNQKSGIRRVRSPLAAPFVAFTDDEKRFAVFPDRLLDVLSGTSDTSIDTRYKAVPKDRNARWVAGTWSTGAYGEDLLQVHVCAELEWVASDGNLGCGWASVDDDDFAQRARGDGD